MAASLQIVRPARREAVARPALDEFGFDPAFTESALPLFQWLYQKYWRVETEGVENVPADGRALLVANHAGVIPWDGAMIRTGIWLEHPQPRHARMLVVNFAFAMPGFAPFLLKTGNVLAHPENAVTLLERDELVGVFPEGVKGAAKAYRERYRVRRFGRGGFVQVALRTGAPIIPVAVVGAEEVHPMVFELPSLARLIGLPTLPITPTFPLLGGLGLLPLPSKWFIAFGRPLETASLGPDAASDPRLVLEVSEEVRGWIQSTVDRLLPRRKTPFY
ncbi:MAG TPA: lysophospholipid acyltransferase family protein [Candidatus Dormibacteraeota bacterium]